ncbi:hypothetical protein MASR1M107_30830 [Ignavibacteriales bacterium]
MLVISSKWQSCHHEEGKDSGLGEPYYQTKIILKKIEQALIDAGASITDVVRTRIFVVDIAMWEDVGRAHNEVFGSIKPACTMVAVTSLVVDVACRSRSFAGIAA